MAKQDRKRFLANPKAADFIILSDLEFARDIFTFKINLDKDKKKHISLNRLYRDGILNTLVELGYYKRCHENNTYTFIRDIANILDEVEPYIMKDEIFARIKANYVDTVVFEYAETIVSIEAAKLHELFLLQSHLIFNDNFLNILPKHIKPIMRDNKMESYYPFQNKVIKVTADNITEIEYSALDKSCIWRKHILKRDYVLSADVTCQFEIFISNICKNDINRGKSVISALGYLLHNYSNPSNGQAVIAYDEEITDLKNPMGGTGKGIIMQAIAQLRTVVKIDGKKFDEKDKFSFQDVNEQTQVVSFDDVKAELGFDRFNSVLTEGWNIEPKRKPSFFIPPKDSPKVYITSNAIIRGEGTTAQRRQFIIELAPFYSNLIKQKLEPIRHTHGCDFFSNDWADQEWNAFYGYMLNCVQYYLAHGLVYCKPIGLGYNKLRQNTSDDFYKWITTKKIERLTWYNVAELFSEFKETYYGTDGDFHRRTLTNWLKIYALTNELEMGMKRSDGKTWIRFQCTSAQETII